jgi:hypothetical protein
MTSNPILDEIYAARENLLAEYNGDLHAYVEAARKRALSSGRPIAQPKRRTNLALDSMSTIGMRVVAEQEAGNSEDS